MEVYSFCGEVWVLLLNSTLNVGFKLMLAALMENKECQLVPEDLASKALGAKEKKKRYGVKYRATKCKAAAGKKALCSIMVLQSSRASAADNSLQEDCSQVDTSTKNATYILLWFKIAEAFVIFIFTSLYLHLTAFQVDNDRRHNIGDWWWEVPVC